MAFDLVSSGTWTNSLIVYGYDESIEIESLGKLKPTRSTQRSAGYDFKMPFDLKCEPGKLYKVPTGFKWFAGFTYMRADVDHPEEYDSEKKFVENREDPFDNTIYVPKIILQIANPVLTLHPRSSLAINYGFRLVNTTGIIDADYYNNPSNEGHIIVAFTVDKELELTKGMKFCQGIILPFLFDGEDDGKGNQRLGGIGSTGK